MGDTRWIETQVTGLPETKVFDRVLISSSDRHLRIISLSGVKAENNQKLLFLGGLPFHAFS